MEALHALTAELHSGFLVLAFVGIVAVFLCQVVVRYRTRMPRLLVKWAVKSRGYFEATGYVAAVAGVIALLLSAYTGMNAWPLDQLLDSAIIRNKILLTIFATILWIGVVLIRTKFGRSLWTCPQISLLYTGLAVVAFGLTSTVGSLGAHITQGGSFLDPLWEAVGIDLTKDLSLDVTVAMFVAIGGVILLIFSLLAAVISGIAKEEFRPKNCTSWSKWDEPKIGDGGQQ
jgi:hypothetical protein